MKRKRTPNPRSPTPFSKFTSKRTKTKQRPVSDGESSEESSVLDGNDAPSLNFKRACAVCEPSFRAAMEELTSQFNRVMRKHLGEIRSEISRLASHQSGATNCWGCRPILDNEMRNVCNRYEELVERNFRDLEMRSKLLVDSCLTRKYSFKLER